MGILTLSALLNTLKMPVNDYGKWKVRHMALYYDIPDDAKTARRATREAAAAHDTEQWKEVLLIYLGGHKHLLKLVIDGQVGRDYGSHTVLGCARFDPSSPETWEAQVSELLDRVPSDEMGRAATTGGVPIIDKSGLDVQTEKLEPVPSKKWWQFWK